MYEKTVFCVMGLPLSGKTTVCEILSKELGIHYIDIDDGPAKCVKPREEEPYRTPESTSTERKRMNAAYIILHSAVGVNLQMGWPCIVSATYSRKSSLKFLRDAVERQGGYLKIILCHFNDTNEEIVRRLNIRLREGEPGGCRSVKHYLSDKERFEMPETPFLEINTSQYGPSEAVNKIKSYI